MTPREKETVSLVSYLHVIDLQVNKGGSRENEKQTVGKRFDARA